MTLGRLLLPLVIACLTPAVSDGRETTGGNEPAPPTLERKLPAPTESSQKATAPDGTGETVTPTDTSSTDANQQSTLNEPIDPLLDPALPSVIPLRIPEGGDLCLTSFYGLRQVRSNRRVARRGPHFHSGIDFRAKQRLPVLSFRDGEVTAVGRGGACGKYVEIKHSESLYSHYCHLSGYKNFRIGEKVKAGDEIGVSGATGSAKGHPHLHFTLKRKPGLVQSGNHFDPTPYFPNVPGCPGAAERERVRVKI